MDPVFFFWSSFWSRNGGHILIQKVDPVFSRNEFYVLPNMNFRIRGWIKSGSKLGPDNDRRMEAKICSQTILKFTSKPHPKHATPETILGQAAMAAIGGAQRLAVASEFGSGLSNKLCALSGCTL